MRTAFSVVATALAVTPLVAQEPYRPPVIGRWDLTLTASDGRKLPSWLEVQVSGNNVLVGRFVAVVGSARPISKVAYANDTLRFAIPPQWEQGRDDLRLEAVLAGETLSGAVTMPDGTRLPLTGVRAPSLHRNAPPRWGTPVRLFNGRDLTGWHPGGGGENQWKVVDGVLSNQKGGANLVTDRTVTDFKLHAEFRYPALGNSGVYLRGRHEVQIEDPDVGTTPSEALGSIYGFIAPNEAVGKKPGEWQTYDITLVGRLLTVVLNGHRIISEQNIPGPTGGALDSNEGAPGPIFLQGDHGPVDYRNIVLTPAR
jgi:hypothetical protein